jgi:hypothetical protein
MCLKSSCSSVQVSSGKAKTTVTGRDFNFNFFFKSHDCEAVLGSKPLSAQGFRARRTAFFSPSSLFSTP